MSATYRRHPRTAARRSDQETCACGPSEPTPPPRSMRLTLSGVASGHSPTTTGHPEPHTSARPHRPPYDSTPILIDRVRRKRQRLRSNGSIESDSAVHHPLSADTPARRVTLDRVLTLVATQHRPMLLQLPLSPETMPQIMGKVAPANVGCSASIPDPPAAPAYAALC